MEFNTILSIIIIIVIVIVIVIFSVLLGVFNKSNTSQDETISENKKLIEENKEAIEAVKRLEEINHRVVYMFDSNAYAILLSTTAKSGERTYDTTKRYAIPVTIYGYYDTSTGEAVISTKQFLLDISDIKSETNIGRTLTLVGFETYKYTDFYVNYPDVTTEIFNNNKEYIYKDVVIGGTFKFAIPTKEITTHHTVYKFSDIKEGILIPVKNLTKPNEGLHKTWQKGYDLFVKNASVNNNVLSYAVNAIGMNNKASVISIALLNVSLIDQKHYEEQEKNSKSSD